MLDLRLLQGPRLVARASALGNNGNIKALTFTTFLEFIYLEYMITPTARKADETRALTLVPSRGQVLGFPVCVTIGPSNSE